MTWWLDISDLDEDQKNIIALPADESHLILGPPGSGKTNLLLVRAEYLTRTSRPNLIVLMFNDALHEFVVRGAAQYELPASKIKKIISWEMVLLRENGIDVDNLPDDLDERRRLLATKILGLYDANPALERHLQALFVDEVQDCLPEEIEVFLRSAEVTCFAGDNRQRIFSPKSGIDSLVGRVKTLELKTHYRIGHQICRAADAIARSAGLEPIEDNCNYKDAVDKIEFQRCTDDADQASKIIAALAIQLTAYPDELLAVAGPRKEDRDYLRQMVQGSPLAPYLLPYRESGHQDANRRIYVAHLREIKGLEFRAIHLGLMQQLHKLGENQKRIAYTAITRARTTVSVYYTGSVPGYLEQARSAIEPPTPKPPLSDLFPKGRLKK